MVEKKRRWQCKLGIHNLYEHINSTNFGTDQHPVWMTIKSYRCTYCDLVKYHGMVD